jgi:hypothetical protein
MPAKMDDNRKINRLFVNVNFLKHAANGANNKIRYISYAAGHGCLGVFMCFGIVVCAY